MRNGTTQVKLVLCLVFVTLLGLGLSSDAHPEGSIWHEPRPSSIWHVGDRAPAPTPTATATPAYQPDVSAPAIPPAPQAGIRPPVASPATTSAKPATVQCYVGNVQCYVPQQYCQPAQVQPVGCAGQVLAVGCAGRVRVHTVRPRLGLFGRLRARRAMGGCAGIAIGSVGCGG